MGDGREASGASGASGMGGVSGANWALERQVEGLLAHDLHLVTKHDTVPPGSSALGGWVAPLLFKN